MECARQPVVFRPIQVVAHALTPPAGAWTARNRPKSFSSKGVAHRIGSAPEANLPALLGGSITLPNDHNFLSPGWSDRDWTSFVPFAATRGPIRAMPTGPGLYRVRVVGREQLAYVGQTRRGLREWVGILARGTLAADMRQCPAASSQPPGLPDARLVRIAHPVPLQPT
jgi:hypothetical protein